MSLTPSSPLAPPIPAPPSIDPEPVLLELGPGRPVSAGLQPRPLPLPYAGPFALGAGPRRLDAAPATLATPGAAPWHLDAAPATPDAAPWHVDAGPAGPDAAQPSFDAGWPPPRQMTEMARSTHHRGRRAASAFFAAATIVCLLVGNLALWMRQDVYSGSNITREAQQIVGSPDVQHAVAALVVNRVVQPALDQVGRRTVLGPLAATVERPVVSMAGRLVDRAVASQPAQQIEARLVEAVTPQLEKGAGPVALSPEQLVGILSPSLGTNAVVAAVLRAADRSGCCTVVLAQRADLAFGWRNIRAIRAAGIALPVLTVVFAALALTLAPRRRRLGIILAAATSIAGVVTLASLAAGPSFWVNFVSQNGAAAGVVRAAGASVFNGASAKLGLRSWALVTGGALGLVALASAGRWSPARRAAEQATPVGVRATP